MTSIIYEFLGFQTYDDFVKDRTEKRRESMNRDINDKISEREQKITDKANLTKKLNDDRDNMASHLKSGKITPQEHNDFLKEHNKLRRSEGLNDELPKPSVSSSSGVTDIISDHPIAAGIAGALGAGLIAKKVMDNKNRKSQYA